MTVGVLFPLLALLYLHVCSGRATHSVPTSIAPEPYSITEPFECRPDGCFDFCVKDNCKMRWKPPRTHHCSTCGVCRLGFDHHCPWVSAFRRSNLYCCLFVNTLSCQLGNCVTTRRLKAFLALLVLTSVVIPLASLPILPILRTHIIDALAASHADAWATDVWWDRPYSWILCGGPPGRWVVGVLFGFHTLRVRRSLAPWLSGSLISQPHARIATLVGTAAFLWLFAVVRISMPTW
jgi:DHHC palmitoyltransferase